MSERIELKNASFVASVMATGSADMTVTSANGVLVFLDRDIGAVVIVNPPSKRRDPLCVPLANVRCFTPLTEDEQLRRMQLAESAAAEQASRKAEAERVAKEAAVQAALPPEKRERPARGVEKSVRNPETGKIETKIV
jgi:hypothetical protein